MESYKRIFGMGVVLIIAFAATFAALTVIEEWRMMQSAEKWHATTGTVVHTVENGRITYEYDINGTTYRSDRVYAFQFFLSADKIELFKQTHPSGSDIVLFYNPNLPSQAAINPWFPNSIPTTPLLLMFIALAFALMLRRMTLHRPLLAVKSYS